MDSGERINELVQAIQASPRYRHITPEFVRQVAANELAKGRGWKDTIKAVKNKLHQVGGAYQETTPDYGHWRTELDGLPPETSDLQLQAFCRQAMRQHASTRERLPILDSFYMHSLSGIAPVRSVLDLACGLNPLAIPWMPLAPDVEYFACDIYADLVDFLQHFFDHRGINGHAETCDLTQSVPGRRVQLALLLKTLPCLEQVDRSIGLRLLDAVPADYLLVSFPAQSLGGRSKGMPENYANSFRQLLGQRPWKYEQFDFATEVAFLVRKG